MTFGCGGMVTRLQRESQPETSGWQEQQIRNKIDGFVKQIRYNATWNVFDWAQTRIVRWTFLNGLMNDSPKVAQSKRKKLFRLNAGAMHYVSPPACERKCSEWFTFSAFSSPAFLSLYFFLSLSFHLGSPEWILMRFLWLRKYFFAFLSFQCCNFQTKLNLHEVHHKVSEEA